jgi:16S rRNA (guanine527-N7)-methyltransferase
MTNLETLAAGSRSLGVELTEAQLNSYRFYLDGLSAWNDRASLTSAAALADAERVHLLGAITLVPLIQRECPEGGRLVDVGSGAGLPGLALKIALPRLDVALVEATRKKTEFLQWMVERLELRDVEVVTGRAEELARRDDLRDAFDVATARALGPLPVALELTLPFCREGGMVLAQRGADADGEAAAARGVAEELGGRLRGVEWARNDERGAVVVVDKIAPTPSRYPRRTGIPAKRPLGSNAAPVGRGD